MARTMHHKERQLPEEETQALLSRGKEGILAVNGDEGYPYAVPVNYIYMDDAIYIHTAPYGYKMESVTKNSKVCFTAIISSEIIEADTTTKYESVIAVGDAAVISDTAQKRKIMEAIVQRLAPSNVSGGLQTIEKLLSSVGIIRIDITELTGKAYR